MVAVYLHQMYFSQTWFYWLLKCCPDNALRHFVISGDRYAFLIGVLFWDLSKSMLKGKLQGSPIIYLYTIIVWYKNGTFIF